MAAAQTHAHAQAQAQEQKRRKTNLLSQCKKIVRKHSSPLTIAVVGTPGCGKSAFLNTVFASLKDGDDGHWREIAREGRYGGLGIQDTQGVRSFPNETYSDEIIPLPTFLHVDMPGFEDEDIAFNREFFNIVIDGKLRDGESLKSVRECFYKMGGKIDRLREEYYNRRDRPDRVVDCIIVVSSLYPIIPLPTNLLKIVRETAYKERDISIFGVLTHADKVQRYPEQQRRRQKTFEENLRLIGTRCIAITNYCVDYDASMSYISQTIPNLDIPVLQLMTQVFQHDRRGSTKNYYKFKRLIIFVSVLVFILAYVISNVVI